MSIGSWGGGGPQTDKTPAESPFTGQFLKIMTFGIAFYQSNLSKVSTLFHRLRGGILLMFIQAGLLFLTCYA